MLERSPETPNPLQDLTDPELLKAFRYNNGRYRLLPGSTLLVLTGAVVGSFKPDLWPVATIGMLLGFAGMYIFDRYEQTTHSILAEAQRRHLPMQGLNLPTLRYFTLPPSS